MNSFWCERMQVLAPVRIMAASVAGPACASSHSTATVSAPRPARGCSSGCRRRAPTSSACRRPRRRNTSSATTASGRPAITAAYFDAKRPGYSGVAIYSKRKPDRVITGFGVPEFDHEGRYLEFQFGRLSVVSLYLPSGSAGPERQASKYRFLDAFLPYLKKLGRRDRDYVLCGDINIAHREIDLKNWKSNRKNSGFLPEERAWLDRVFGELKWVDAFREVDPRPEQYTWWSNRGQARAKNVGWRIDYQIASRSLAGRARAASIYRDSLVLRPRAAHDGLRAVKAWGAVKPYLEKESLAAFFVGVSSGFPVRDDRRHADDATRAGRHRQADHHRVHARLPGLQPEGVLGLDRRRRAHSAARPARPARVLAAARRRRRRSRRS